MAAFFNVLSAMAFFLSCVALLLYVRVAAHVRELLDQPQHLSESRLRSLETSLAEQADALQAVANRVKMQKVRNAANHVPDRDDKQTPDPYRDPEAWRKHVNKSLAMRIPQ